MYVFIPRSSQLLTFIQIKLENILLFLDDERLVLKISDFGLSISPDEKPILLADRLGSLHYSAHEFFCAPEKWSLHWSYKQDYFSLGICLMSLM